MASNTPVETAKIYQFPTGGRAGVTERTAAAQQAIELENVAASRIAVGGSWYHDAAVQETNKDKQH